MPESPFKFTLLFALLLFNSDLFSQWFLPVCKNFGVEDYTEDAEFHCATSDNKGTIYFGSNYGVFVYRGEKKSTGKSWDIMRLCMVFIPIPSQTPGYLAKVIYSYFHLT